MDILLAVGSIAVSEDAIHRTNVRSRSCRAGRSPQGGVVAAGLVAKYVVDSRETSHPSAVLGWVILSAAFVPWALLPVDVYTYARPAWLPSPLAVTRALGDAGPSPTWLPTWGLCRTCAASRTSVRTQAHPLSIHCTPGCGLRAITPCRRSAPPTSACLAVLVLGVFVAAPACFFYYEDENPAIPQCQRVRGEGAPPAWAHWPLTPLLGGSCVRPQSTRRP